VTTVRVSRKLYANHSMVIPLRNQIQDKSFSSKPVLPKVLEKGS